MQRKQILVALLLLIRACVPIVAQESEESEESEGWLQQAGDIYRTAKAEAHKIEVVLGLAGAFYEEHVKLLAGNYTDWASASTSSFWKQVKAQFT
ncbi:apolipoprotein C-IV [Esox lucius]|uniref:apolipoprotein C-IV n=1 Tax=Esox lucius TaxID=8010 RepID=UPI001477477D|nr:apolipoprotein C-IV [Esox lucius]